MNQKIISAIASLMISIPVAVISYGDRYIVKPTQNVYTAEDEFYSANTPVEKRYFDVPIDHDLQDYIIDTCRDYNIAPAVIIAMIERESMFTPDAVGDDGCSTGLMQIQEKWHRDRMERLGCTDLYDEKQNITVGIDYLAELFGVNEEILWVLMAYNGGMAYANRNIDNPTDYAIYITERAYELERSYEDGH